MLYIKTINNNNINIIIYYKWSYFTNKNGAFSMLYSKETISEWLGLGTVLCSIVSSNQYIRWKSFHVLRKVWVMVYLCDVKPLRMNNVVKPLDHFFFTDITCFISH